MPGDERILVIKHGALGDWVLATGCFAAIRRHHPSARITLLTTPAFADWGTRCPWFDEVWTDDRPSLLAKPLAWVRLRRRLIGGEFARVYDLQTSGRTGLYFRMLPRRHRPEWSGEVADCSHPHRNPQQASMHTIAVRADQLGVAGIEDVPAPALDWLDAGIDEFSVPEAFSLMVPGGSAHRPEKRWPAEKFADLARLLAERGSPPVLIGGHAEAATLDRIAREVPDTIDLGGRTSLAQIAALARRATCAVGNDTGPIHITATVGCPTVVLFGAASDPKRSAPCGDSVTILRHETLTGLPVDDVIDAVQRISRSA
ncbi:MAG: glycosyltransferase family 9 protein [Rhodospirillales bacterium]|nr:glycosyltransferase family 9 protein [Rhodospirillales bacterium]